MNLLKRTLCSIILGCLTTQAFGVLSVIKKQKEKSLKSVVIEQKSYTKPIETVQYNKAITPISQSLNKPKKFRKTRKDILKQSLESDSDDEEPRKEKKRFKRKILAYGGTGALVTLLSVMPLNSNDNNNLSGDLKTEKLAEKKEATIKQPGEPQKKSAGQKMWDAGANLANGVYAFTLGYVIEKIVTPRRGIQPPKVMTREEFEQLPMYNGNPDQRVDKDGLLKTWCTYDPMNYDWNMPSGPNNVNDSHRREEIRAKDKELSLTAEISKSASQEVGKALGKEVAKSLIETKTIEAPELTPQPKKKKPKKEEPGVVKQVLDFAAKATGDFVTSTVTSFGTKLGDRLGDDTYDFAAEKLGKLGEKIAETYYGEKYFKNTYAPAEINKKQQRLQNLYELGKTAYHTKSSHKFLADCLTEIVTIKDELKKDFRYFNPETNQIEIDPEIVRKEFLDKYPDVKLYDKHNLFEEDGRIFKIDMNAQSHKFMVKPISKEQVNLLNKGKPPFDIQADPFLYQSTLDAQKIINDRAWKNSWTYFAKNWTIGLIFGSEKSYEPDSPPSDEFDEHDIKFDRFSKNAKNKQIIAGASYQFIRDIAATRGYVEAPTHVINNKLCGQYEPVFVKKDKNGNNKFIVFDREANSGGAFKVYGGKKGEKRLGTYHIDLKTKLKK